MNDASNTKSRKMAARLMLGTAVLALPLTASITYAESLAPEAPLAGFVGPEVPPAPPAPPAIGLSQGAPAAPEAPQAPQAPEPHAAGQGGEYTIITVDPDTGEAKTIDVRGDSSTLHTVKVKDRDVLVVRSAKGQEIDMAKLAARLEAGEGGFEEFAKRLAEREVEIEGIEGRLEREELDQERPGKRQRVIRLTNRGLTRDKAEIEVSVQEMKKGLAEAREAAEMARIELKAVENSKEWKAGLKEGGSGRTFVTMSCDNASDEVATTIERKDGTTEVMICQKRVMSYALKGLEQARVAIARNSELDSKTRREVLKELDEQIKSWRKDAR